YRQRACGFAACQTVRHAIAHHLHDIFFVSRYADPRALLSFPTRRSSDLDAEVGGQVRLTGSVNDIHPVGGFQLSRGRLAILGQRDRKSTRLNSSHVKISYAVFCLKKKTGRKTTTSTCQRTTTWPSASGRI